MEGYPRRPKFFALRFVRLMAKVCLANELGPQAFTLLAIIASTEDAGGYRKPVTFWNEQLFPLAGLGSVSALKRLREKVVEAGWLHYEAGAKGRAAKYWVVIPEGLESIDDGPSDEQPGEYSGSLVNQNRLYSGLDSGSLVDGKADRIRTESGQKADRIRTECEPHSSLTLPLTLSQEEKERAAGRVNSAIRSHESAFSPLLFPERFQGLVKRHPDKSPAKRAEVEWKQLATSEAEVERIEKGHAAWMASERWKDRIGIPTLANFLRERWFDNHPEPEKPRDNAKRAERTSARYDPAIHG